MSFVDPWLLLLLLLIPVAIFLAARGRSGLDRARRILSTALRGLVILFLVLAAADTQRVETNDRLATMFVLDMSRSVPPSHIERARSFIAESIVGKARDDVAGLVLFGREARVEIAPVAGMQLNWVGSSVDRDSTDIGAALRLAAASMPDGCRKRIVLFTDGCENIGTALEEARRAAFDGCSIDVVPFSYDRTNEVLVEGVHIPQTLDVGESYDVKIVIKSLKETGATVRVFQNGEIIATERVQLAAGKTPLKVTRKAGGAGLNTFEAIVEPDAGNDTLPENNRGYGFAFVSGASTVLYLGDDEESARFLEEVLREEKIGIDIRGSDAIPRELAEFGMYDAIVIANVPAARFASEQMRHVENAVRDLGIGLVMIGGRESFGAGGYLGTPIEEALPVKMDISQNLVRPNSGIVFVMDNIWCIGNSWSKEICKETIKNLTERMDFVGLITERDALQWVIALQEVRDKAEYARQIDAMYPGDVQSFDRSLEMVLAEFPRTSASYKHVVLITDGQPSPAPTDAVIARLQREKITLSVVVIEPRGSVDAFREAARKGGGNFYVVQPNERTKIPEIITKESNVIRKGLFFEETFTPRVVKYMEIFKGIDINAIPSLKGYNATSPREAAVTSMISHHGDPVLAVWRYGLGKSVAFTSDCSRRWAANWIHWADFKKFWLQTVRWTLREGSRSDYRIATSVADETGRVIIDAVEPDGSYANNIGPTGTVVAPDGTSRPLEFAQTGPGRYLSSFPMNKPGKYVVSSSYTAGNGRKGFFTGGLAMAYSPEYRDLGSNDVLLRDVAEAGGGRLSPKAAEVFEHNLPPSTGKSELWPLFLLLAILIFPIDIFVRRVVITRAQVAAVLTAIVESIPWLKEAARRWRERQEAKQMPVPVGVDVAAISGEVDDRTYTTEGGSASEEVKRATGKAAIAPPRQTVTGPSQPAAKKEDDSYLGRLMKAKKKAQTKIGNQ